MGDELKNQNMPIKEQVKQQLDKSSNQKRSSNEKLLNSSTGIKQLDKLLGGGFPKGAVILVAGSSGSGKTIFSFQWLFEGIKNNENSLYMTLTEPLFKSLKNLETLSFYDRSAIEQERLKIIDIRDIYEKKGFNQKKVINFIEEEVKKINAKRLCIDSVTAIAYNLNDKAQIRTFIFELGKILTTLGCTTMLTSEVGDEKKFSVYGVEEFISDAILRLDQIKIKDELQRTMQIIKVRGRGYEAEDLNFRITKEGINVFPKLKVPLEYSSTTERVSTGVPLLDKMILGGIFRGSSILIVGSTGTGKSLLSMQFILEGLNKGEPCLYAGFEESRDQLRRNAETFGWDITKYEQNGLLVLHCAYPTEKYIEEHLASIKNIIESKKIKRCVVDSLSSISHSFPQDIFISFAKRLNAYLKRKYVTTYFTAATTSLIGGTALTESHLSTMTDGIIMLRYVEMQGELELVINIIKMRGSNHSKSLVNYDITSKGIVVGQSLSGYEGVMTGITRKVSETIEEKLEAEFKRFIGPMGVSIFSDLKNKGLSKSNIMDYIDDLTVQGILKNEDSNRFKEEINGIMGPSFGMEPKEVKIFAAPKETQDLKLEHDPLMPSRQIYPDKKEEKTKSKEQKKGFLTKLFKKEKEGLLNVC